MNDTTTEIYAHVGHDQPFYDLVNAFYKGVEADDLLRPLYPEDLSEAKLHLTLFLIQRFGGHTEYGDSRGHPRLGLRHAPFRIGHAEKDAWLRHMLAAVDATTPLAPFRDVLHRYFVDAAEFLVNTKTIPTLDLPAPRKRT